MRRESLGLWHLPWADFQFVSLRSGQGQNEACNKKYLGQRRFVEEAPMMLNTGQRIVTNGSLRVYITVVSRFRGQASRMMPCIDGAKVNDVHA